MEDYRFLAQQSTRTDTSIHNFVSPPRDGNRLSQPTAHQDTRSALHRRFTTDSGRVPTLSSVAVPRAIEPQNFATPVSQPKTHSAQYEKRKLEYEKLKDAKRLFEVEMAKLEQQQRLEEMEIAMQEDMHRANGLSLTGHQSEPTTPPEYRETASGFPTFLSRPNRYSTSSIVSPPGIVNRTGRSGSQLASPQSGIVRSATTYDDFPTRSVPESRRNSEEDEKEEALRQDPTSHRATNATNRYSMPVTRHNIYDNIDQTNSTGFLFGKDDESNMESSYNTVDGGDDAFPTMYSTRKHNPNRNTIELSCLEAANGWNKVTSLHRPQQSLTSLSQLSSAETGTNHNAPSPDISGIPSRPASFRHSLDLKQQQQFDLNSFYTENPVEGTSSVKSPPVTQAIAAPPAAGHMMAPPNKIQPSYSTNNLPTAKSTDNASGIASSNAHAQNHLHQHNASIGRIPPGVMAKRHSRELSNDGYNPNVPNSNTFPSISSTLHPSAPAFGPTTPMGSSSSQGLMQTTPVSTSSASSTGPVPFSSPYYNPAHSATGPSPSGYNMNVVAMNMNGLNLNSYTPQPYGSGYATPVYHAQQPRDPQMRSVQQQQRRFQENEGVNRFQHTTLDEMAGSILQSCKDQHGCRFLQKQLENHDPTDIHKIWQETNEHVVELMTDPFGNYLCQKLLEYCSDDERTALIRNAMPHMQEIAVNQHGTRALQKMIEYVRQPEHILMIIEGLRNRVVPLIKDLNGNHVIQKCLNKLSDHDAQFIIDAVGQHVVEVGTHRHGCCVLQRCIDHATGEKKMWLIGCITENAFFLVQDPFGNYVVQYIIDLNEPTFTEPVIQMFLGKINMLSCHKFSSNVVEKCLRCGSEEAQDAMISEMLAHGELDRLLKDGFANYVVQTALEAASMDMQHTLIEAIRPVLPSIRNTPYGRRLQTKVQTFDNRMQHQPRTGQRTPSDLAQGQLSERPNRDLDNRGQPLLSISHSSGVSAPPTGFSSSSQPGRVQVAHGGRSGQNVHVGPHTRLDFNIISANMPVPQQPPPQPPRPNQNRYPPYGGGPPPHPGGDGHFF